MEERLAQTIGPAPSECTFEEFLERLRVERQRVVQALQDYKTSAKQPKKKVGKKAKTLSPEEQKKLDLLKELKAKGVDLSAFESFLKSEEKI